VSESLFLTGATGFLGMEVLARYLERTDRAVYALVRADDRAGAEERLRGRIAQTMGDVHRGTDRVVAIPGDVEQPELGLDSRMRDGLASAVGDIVHSAASVSFTLPLEQSRSINVEGTRHVLDFAELCRRRGGLRRLSYVSTAYVAGTHAGEFAEDDFDVGQDFRNPYERTKFEAERLVRSAAGRLPVQILRPSIIVGERPSGWTGSFNVLYSPLKAFARGSLPALPARRSAPVDVVPVDYVADAIFELANGPPADNRTYHLVAGPQATTVERLVELSALGLRRPRPALVPAGLYRRIVHPLLVRVGGDRRRRALTRMEAFFPYFSMRVSYANEGARHRLGSAGIRMTPIERYFGRLLEFALRARWGRSPVGRARARAELAERRRGGPP
jgi:thioester reductase-like protein